MSQTLSVVRTWYKNLGVNDDKLLQINLENLDVHFYLFTI